MFELQYPTSSLEWVKDGSGIYETHIGIQPPPPPHIPPPLPLPLSRVGCVCR